jgi:integrase
MSRGRKPQPHQYKKALPAKSAFALTPRGPWEKGRASLTLLLVERNSQGKRVATPYTCPAVIELNRQFREGLLTPEQARIEMERVRGEEYKRIEEARKEHLHANNTALVEKYIRSVIDKKVDILTSSRNSQIDSAWAVVERLRKLDLGRATQNEIQRVLNGIDNRGAFLKAIQSTRSMLRYIGRHDVAAGLRMKRIEEKHPPYLTADQVAALVKAVPANVTDKWPLMPELIRTIFNLGVRFSEALAIQKADVMKKEGVTVVRIHRQYAARVKGEREEDRLRKTKNKRVRYVVPINTPECLRDLAKWISAYPEFEQREPYRGITSKLVHELANKLFSNKEESPTSEAEGFFFDETALPNAEEIREYKGIHMLRASHAVYLMEQFGNENLVANQLGDTPEVIRKHYSGRFNTDKTLKFMADTLQKKPAKN